MQNIEVGNKPAYATNSGKSKDKKPSKGGGFQSYNLSPFLFKAI